MTASYRRLAKAHDVIVLEGAGSPAEINLMDVDIVNMAAARLAKAPVFLVGDIDKGGVFASLYGTVKLVGRDASRIKGFIINKFRGDPAILRPGLDMISAKTGKPVIGVLPWAADLGLPEEDGLALKSSVIGKRDASLRIVVVRLRYISNFTDFDPLAQEPDVDLVYSIEPFRYRERGHGDPARFEEHGEGPAAPEGTRSRPQPAKGLGKGHRGHGHVRRLPDAGHQDNRSASR